MYSHMVPVSHHGRRRDTHRWRLAPRRQSGCGLYGNVGAEARLLSRSIRCHPVTDCVILWTNVISSKKMLCCTKSRLHAKKKEQKSSWDDLWHGSRVRTLEQIGDVSMMTRCSVKISADGHDMTAAVSKRRSRSPRRLANNTLKKVIFKIRSFPGKLVRTERIWSRRCELKDSRRATLRDIHGMMKRNDSRKRRSRRRCRLEKAMDKDKFTEYLTVEVMLQFTTLDWERLPLHVLSSLHKSKSPRRTRFLKMTEQIRVMTNSILVCVLCFLILLMTVSLDEMDFDFVKKGLSYPNWL